MNTERIQPAVNRFAGYRESRKNLKQKKKVVASRPIEAITFDILDLSSEKPQDTNEYSWLEKVIAGMSDEEVARKMNQLKNSSIVIDDALAEKIIFEAL